MLHLLNFLPHCLHIADQASRPNEDALTFRGETQKAGGPLDQGYVQDFFELLDALREGRLRDAAALGRTAEVPFAGQCDHEFQLV